MYKYLNKESKTIMKKRMLIAIALSVLCITGCSSKKDENQGNQQTTTETVTEKVTEKTVDAFTLRNGIHFGDSFEEVKEKETIELNNLQRYEDDLETEGFETEADNIKKKSDTTYVYSKYGTIANIENSQIKFTFKDNSLTKMEYTLGNYDSYDASEASKLETLLKDNFESVVSTLTEKYGDPIYIEEGKEFKFHTSVWETYKMIMEFMSMGLGGDTIGFKEWLVEAEDGSHVVIDAGAFYNESLYDGSLRGEFEVAYEIIPDDKWDDVINTAIEKKNNMDNDL